MKWQVPETEKDYKTAATRLMDIFDAEQDTPDGDEMELLLVLVNNYDDKHYNIKPTQPIETTI